ncbi:hypothetical protein [uncultured Shimia sp.]|uniref:hypothetical protein n=1 Tax=uncultured Shimia sp. TaxID=573152 RepID=UPI0025CD9E88|nr:hypothetical protein [uncultured Shimia sp.]
MTDGTHPQMRLFTPEWLRALLRGERTTGETFWVGNYGTALFHQPLMALLLVLPINAVIPGALTSLLVVYQFTLTIAVWRSTPGVPTPIGWKIAGVLLTLGHTALFAVLTRALFTSGT